MIRHLLVVAAALLVFAAAFVLRDWPRGDSSSVTSDGLEIPLGAVEAPLPRLVDLGSDRCIPCKQMAPILEELATEYRGIFQVEFIDVWKDPEAGEIYGVRVIPTQVFIDASGQERFRHEGFLAKQSILSQWAELGVDLSAKSPSEEP